MEILGKLMELLETEEIDLVILNTAPLTLRMKILENKKIIADKGIFRYKCDCRCFKRKW